jgi:hypothetical protein
MAALGLMKYSIRKTVWTDWPALAAAIGIPIIWIIHFLFPYLRKGDPLPWSFPTIISALLLATLYWRVQRVARLFSSGMVIPGHVTRLSIAKDRGRLEFRFEFDGQRIDTWTPIHTTKAVQSLKQGSPIEVLADRTQPKRAIVKSLYE